MKNMISLSKKIVLSAGVVFANFAFAQTVQEGIANVDSHKYAKAKQIFGDMITKAPNDASNYFYLGNSYLSQFDPNFEKAEEYFKKGLALDSKGYLNKIGLASVKLAKGDKSAIAEIQKIVTDSREKDPEVLYRAAEALTMFEKASSPDLAIGYLTKAVEKAQKGGVPAYYYYSLGDAYRLKKDPGNAMTAYDKASAVAKNKASVFTRMGTLWMAAQQWKQAKENIDKAIAVDPTYAPAYKALAAYNFRFQENAKVTQNLIDYTKYADEDGYTMLEIAKLHFINNDYDNAKTVLNKVFDKVDDPIKYKLKAYLDYSADGNYASAQENLNKFNSSVKDKERIQPADRGLEGLIIAALAKDEKDAAKKAQMMADATAKVAIAKNAKDQTMDWDAELAKIQSGGAINAASVDAGPTSPKVEGLKAKIKANPKDVNALVELGTAYQEVQNWNGAIMTWDKMIALSPNWAYSHYAKGSAYQQLGNHDMAEASYEKFIAVVNGQTAEEQAQNKETMSYAYYLVAFYNQDKNIAKAKEYAAKAVELNPAYADAVTLNNQLMKK
ncbi:hypothetical protein MHJ94_06780 [Chryseobacterium taklimakanense]|uniref:tetratricopeptide repeat protein n=1 Tax=Chryseobacterium taklimakanense TaxID=536441 RepID=UPI001EF73D36|nr:hypothetical protein [Chryseobacterium taklimakanense]MCG7281001.1 hypothetical protein [Chryseobacterium taklimakanense]